MSLEPARPPRLLTTGYIYPRGGHFVGPTPTPPPYRLSPRTYLPWIMTLRLYELDRSSDRFPDQLYQLLHDEEHVECLQKLPKDELDRLINYLNDVRFPLTSEKCH